MIPIKPKDAFPLQFMVSKIVVLVTVRYAVPDVDDNNPLPPAPEQYWPSMEEFVM